MDPVDAEADDAPEPDVVDAAAEEAELEAELAPFPDDAAFDDAAAAL